jgi:hypothetical protein
MKANITDNVMKGWHADGGNGTVKATNADGTFSTNGKDVDTLLYNGITYQEDFKSDESFKPKNATGKLQEKLVSEFRRIHGVGDGSGDIKKYSVIFYDGRFWEYNAKGEIVPMAKKG